MAALIFENYIVDNLIFKNNPNFNQISSSNNLFGVKREKLENNFIYLAIGIQQINHACMKKFEYKVK